MLAGAVVLALAVGGTLLVVSSTYANGFRGAPRVLWVGVAMLVVAFASVLATLLWWRGHG